MAGHSRQRVVGGRKGMQRRVSWRVGKARVAVSRLAATAGLCAFPRLALRWAGIGSALPSKKGYR